MGSCNLSEVRRGLIWFLLQFSVIGFYHQVTSLLPDTTELQQDASTLLNSTKNMATHRSALLPKADWKQDASAFSASKRGSAAAEKRSTPTVKYTGAFANINDTDITFPYVPISVIIPATADRFDKMAELLKTIARGTRLPMEIIVAVSLTTRREKDGSLVPNGKLVAKFDFTLPIPKGLHVTFVGSEGKNYAGANRNIAAEHATMPVLAAVDSDDLVGYDWIETVFHVFNDNRTSIDALLHKWFPCWAGPKVIPPSGTHGFLENNTWSLETPHHIMIVNDLFANLGHSNNVTGKDINWKHPTYTWVKNPPKVELSKTPPYSDPGFIHPWWQNGHISVKRDVYMKVKQNGDLRNGQDTAFVVDLLHRGFKVGSIRNRLTGYQKQK